MTAVVKIVFHPVHRNASQIAVDSKFAYLPCGVLYYAQVGFEQAPRNSIRVCDMKKVPYIPVGALLIRYAVLA